MKKEYERKQSEEILKEKNLEYMIDNLTEDQQLRVYDKLGSTTIRRFGKTKYGIIDIIEALRNSNIYDLEIESDGGW